MATTQAELDAIKAAYKTGAEEVTYQDKKTKFRSKEDMLAIIHEMEVELGLRPDPRAPVRLLANPRKGTT